MLPEWAKPISEDGGVATAAPVGLPEWAKPVSFDAPRVSQEELKSQRLEAMFPGIAPEGRDFFMKFPEDKWHLYTDETYYKENQQDIDALAAKHSVGQEQAIALYKEVKRAEMDPIEAAPLPMRWIGSAANKVGLNLATYAQEAKLAGEELAGMWDSSRATKKTIRNLDKASDYFAQQQGLALADDSYGSGIVEGAGRAIPEYMGVGVATGSAGVLPYLFAGEARNAWYDAKDAGHSDLGASLNAAAHGGAKTAIAAVFGRVLGAGVDRGVRSAVGQVLAKNLAPTLAKMNPSLQKLTTALAQGGSEGGEEFVTELANTAINTMAGIEMQGSFGERLLANTLTGAAAGTGAGVLGASADVEQVLSTIKQQADKTVAEVAQAVTEADSHEGPPPRTDRRGFAADTGITRKTSQAEREAYAETVRARQEAPAEADVMADPAPEMDEPQDVAQTTAPQAEPEPAQSAYETTTPDGRPMPAVDQVADEYNAPDIEKRLNFAQEPEPGVKPISPLEVQKTIKNLIQSFSGSGIIRAGIFGPGKKKASGQFTDKTEVARSRQAYNFPTIYHEAGHAIESAVYKQMGSKNFSNWTEQLKDNPTAYKELVDAGTRLYGANIGQTAAAYDGEGFAEFTRIYATDPKLVKEQFPEFTKWFERNFVKTSKQRAALAKTRDAVHRYAKQGAKNRALQHIVDTGSPAYKVEGMKEGVEYLWRNGKRLFLDSGAELERASKEAQRVRKHRGKKPLDPMDDPYRLYDALRMTAGARVADWVAHGQTDMWGNVVGPALQSINAILPKGSRQDFTAYLYAMRHIALQPFKINTGLRDADALAIFQELDSPEFQQAAQIVHQFSENTLNYMSEASPVLAEHVQKIRDKYGESSFYIPLARVFENVDDAMLSGMGGSATSNPLKRLRGSTLRIKDPLQQLVTQTARMVQRAHDMFVFERLLDLSNQGIGEFVEQVPRELIPEYVTSVDKAAQMLNQALRQTGMEVAIVEAESGIEGSPSDMLTMEDAALPVTFFGKAIVPPGGKPIIPYVHDGQIKWFMVSKGIYELFNGGPWWSQAASRLMNFAPVRWTITNPARVFRAGATGLNVAFQTVSNPARDLSTYLFNAKAGSIRDMLFAYFGMFKDSAIDSLSGGKYSGEMAQLFRRLGLHMSQPIREGSDPLRRMVHRITPTSTGLAGGVERTRDVLETAWDYMVDVLQTSESVPRTAAMKLIADQYGWKEGDPVTPEMAIEMMLAAKKTTVDFTAAGDVTGIVRQSVPFFNVAFQAPRAAARAIESHPQRYLAMGAALTAFSVAMWMRDKDEEWWQEEEGYNKWMYHHVRIGDEVLLIPKDQEASMIFSSMPVALLDALYQKDPQVALDFANTLLETHMPSPLDAPVLRTAREWESNYDNFRDAPVVPQGLQNRAPEDQFNEYTSQPAIAAGQATGLSPMQIDHAIQNLTGGLGGRMFDAVGVGGKVTKVEEPASLPLIGKLFKRGGALGNRPKSLDSLYEARSRAMQRQYDPVENETELQRQQRLAVEDAVGAVSELMQLRADTSNSSLRRAITKQAVDIAKFGLEQENAETPKRDKDRFNEIVADFKSRMGVEE